MNDIYLTLDEYNDFVSKAHAQYMANRFHTTKETQDQLRHPADLAIETSAFFEASYLVIDTFMDTIRNKRKNAPTDETKKEKKK